MRDTNYVCIVGRLCKDVEVKYTGSGMAIGNLSVANNYTKKTGSEYKDDVNYFDVSVFGKQCESLQAYLKRGTQICVTGEMRQERWEKDGKKNSKVSILASNIQLLGGRKDGNAPAGGIAKEQESFAGSQNIGDDGFPENFPF